MSMDFTLRLSSNHKVLNYLNNNKSMFPCVDSSISNGYFLFKDQHRYRAGSDGDSSIRSDSSPASTLSDPIADSNHESSTNSTSEEFDFNLAFEQISSDDDDDGDGDDKISINSNEDYLRQTSERTLIDDNDHDSTFTLCVDDLDELSPIVLRSNSIDILQWENNSEVPNKPSKKVVRFADAMGLDLESIRYMTPPDPSSSSTWNDNNIRLKLEQIRLSRSLSIANSYGLSSFSASSSSSKQYNLVSKNFTPPKNIVPVIYEQKILLECLYTKDSTAYGTIRVHNFVYDKRVFVRLTKDEWNSYQDIQAWHSMNYTHDQTDVFTFQIALQKSHNANEIPKRFVFALCVQVMSDEYWDNNRNQNYVLDVHEKR